MTKIQVNFSYACDVYVHVYGYGTNTTYHKYPQAGQPIDCVCLSGEGNYVLYILGSSPYKMVTVVNASNTTKRVKINSNGTVNELPPWGSKQYITYNIDSGANTLSTPY